MLSPRPFAAPIRFLPHPPGPIRIPTLAATTSLYFSMCVHRRLTPDVDIVFVEFAINDQPGPLNARSMERLVRKLLR